MSLQSTKNNVYKCLLLLVFAVCNLYMIFPIIVYFTAGSKQPEELMENLTVSVAPMLLLSGDFFPMI